MEAPRSLLRLNHFLARAGVSSRRAADGLIASGAVAVNGAVVTELGTKVDSVKDSVLVDGVRVRLGRRHVYIALNKPCDCITTAADERGRRTALDLVDCGDRVFPVGRLDRNTTGLLLLTNDGELARRLMHPGYGVPRVYLVRLDRPLTPAERTKLELGVFIEPGVRVACSILRVAPGDESVEILLHEGKYHEVRRIFASLGREVKRLHRVSYAGITVGGLARGEWRYLRSEEVARLRAAVHLVEKPATRRVMPNE